MRDEVSVVGSEMSEAAGATWEIYRTYMGGFVAGQEQDVELVRHFAGVFLEGAEHRAVRP